MKRVLLFLSIVAVFVVPWVMYAEIPLVVIGQPTSTGLLQHAREEPFFNGLPAATGLPLKVTYKPLKWNQFSTKQQAILQTAFDAYLEDLWAFSQYRIPG